MASISNEPVSYLTHYAMLRGYNGRDIRQPQRGQVLHNSRSRQRIGVTPQPEYRVSPHCWLQGYCVSSESVALLLYAVATAVPPGGRVSHPRWSRCQRQRHRDGVPLHYDTRCRQTEREYVQRHTDTLDSAAYSPGVFPMGKEIYRSWRGAWVPPVGFREVFEELLSPTWWCLKKHINPEQRL